MYKLCQNNHSASRQRQLEQGLLALMLEKNYEDISISDLCNRMQIPRRAFYRYFSSKDGALYAMLDHCLIDFYMEEPVDPGSPALGDLKHFFLFWKQHSDLLEALNKSNLAGIMIQRATVLAQQEGKLPQPIESLPDDVRQIAMTFTVSGLMSMVFQWHLQGYRVSTSEITKLAVSMLTKPLLTKERQL